MNWQNTIMQYLAPVAKNPLYNTGKPLKCRFISVIFWFYEAKSFQNMNGLFHK